jgi:hypothetical protein
MNPYESSIALAQLKKEFEFGLTPDGLRQLILIDANQMVCMKIRSAKGDARPWMTAAAAFELAKVIEIREMWILEVTSIG